MERLIKIKPAFIDKHGEIINVFEGEIKHIAVIKSKKGSVRANHYHKKLHQYAYILSGEMEAWCCTFENPQKKQKLVAKPGDLVDTPHMIPHAQYFRKDTVYISLSTTKRLKGKYEQDTTDFRLLRGK